jgi:hypothetical protein
VVDTARSTSNESTASGDTQTGPATAQQSTRRPRDTGRHQGGCTRDAHAADYTKF